MTKVFKCGKIRFMKTQKIFKTKYLLILFLSLALAVSALGLISVNKAKASTTISQELVLPKSSLEYQALLNPVDAYSDQDITAVLQEGKLIMYHNGEYQIITDAILEQAKQIKKLNDQKLLLSSGTITREVDISTKTISTFNLNNLPVGSTFFDFNQKYLVTTAGTTAKAYTFDGSALSDDKIVNIATDSPIAINENDEVFFIKDNRLKKHKINTAEEIALADVIPSKIIANNDYVFYLLGNEVYKLSVNGGQPQLLISPSSQFDLGKIVNPQSISFKGDNLLITGDNAVQEFKVTADGKLEFTGFAIAKGKTAFNRVNSVIQASGNKLEIEREKNTLAVLDNSSLTVIDVKGQFDSYNKENFTHYSNNALSYINSETQESVKPDTFALGEGSALMLYNQNTSASKLSLLDFNTGAKATEFNIINGNVIRDICYQSGKYYALLDLGDNQARVYQSDGVSFSNTPIASLNFYADVIEVDVFGNIYLYGNSQAYKIDVKDSSAKIALPNLSGVKKLESDLAGNIFALTNNAVYYLNQNQWEEYQFTATAELRSFAMDYDKKDVYLVYDKEELVFKTANLPNVAIDDIEIPTSFITTAQNATDNFKAYSAKANANVYSVTKADNGNFNFDKLITENADYAFVTEINKNGLKLFALAGQNDLVLINADEVDDKSPQKITDNLPENAFITTSVSGYYLPIITANGDYALTDTDTVRLKKEQSIKPLHLITFLNKDYYFAEFKVDQTTYTGYVPVDYTIAVLSQDFKWDNYTVEKVAKTTVYSEKELTTSITELENDTSVRVISVDDGVAYIAFSTQSGYVTGYIDASSILAPQSTAIRNILIIIAVMASVCGTTTFFILRKKK